MSNLLLQVKYYWTLETDLDGIPVVISRTGWTGEMGYEIYLRDPSRGNELWERIMEAGKPHSIRPIAPCEARKIEAGILNHGQSMTIANNPYEIMVSTGAKQCVHNALMCLAEPGDEVILLAPYWTSYMDNILYTGATPVVIPSSIKRGFKINPEHLADAITERTRVLILNTPNNPSGVYYTAQELRKIANIVNNGRQKHQ